MFKSLDEVIEVWKQRYALSGDRDDLLPSVGYDAEQIDQVSERLGLTLHYSLRSLLQRANFDTVFFKDLGFAGGGQFLNFLTLLNDGTYTHQAKSDDLIVIGGAGAYNLILDNLSGAVYVGAMYSDGQLISIADSLEECILRAAEIAHRPWPPFKDRDEAIEIASRYLDDKAVTTGREFWIALIRDAT